MNFTKKSKCTLVIITFAVGLFLGVPQSDAYTAQTTNDPERAALLAQIAQLQTLIAQLLELQARQAGKEVSSVAAAPPQFTEGDALRPSPDNPNSYLAPKVGNVSAIGISFDYQQYGDEDFDVGYTTHRDPAVHSYGATGEYSEWRLVNENDLVATVSLLEEDTFAAVRDSIASLEGAAEVSLRQLEVERFDMAYEIYNQARDFGYYIAWYGFEQGADRFTVMVVVPFGVTTQDTVSPYTDGTHTLTFRGLHFSSITRAEGLFEFIMNTTSVYADTVAAVVGSRYYGRPSNEPEGYDRDEAEQARYRVAIELRDDYYDTRGSYEGFCSSTFIAGIVEANDGWCYDTDDTIVAWYEIHDRALRDRYRYYCIDAVQGDEYRNGYVQEIEMGQELCGYQTPEERALDEAIERAKRRD